MVAAAAAFAVLAENPRRSMINECFSGSALNLNLNPTPPPIFGRF